MTTFISPKLVRLFFFAFLLATVGFLSRDNTSWAVDGLNPANQSVPTPTSTNATIPNTPTRTPTGTLTPPTPTPTRTSIPPTATRTSTPTATPTNYTIAVGPNGGVFPVQVQGVQVLLDFPPGLFGPPPAAANVVVGLTNTASLPPGLRMIGDGGFFIEAFNVTSGQPITTFAPTKELTISVIYAAPQANGLIMALARVYYWDTQTLRWVALPGAADVVLRRLYGTVGHLTTFAAQAPIARKLYLPTIRR